VSISSSFAFNSAKRWILFIQENRQAQHADDCLIVSKLNDWLLMNPFLSFRMIYNETSSFLNSRRVWMNICGSFMSFLALPQFYFSSNIKQSASIV
jgi:hypothetical protein